MPVGVAPHFVARQAVHTSFGRITGIYAVEDPPISSKAYRGEIPEDESHFERIPGHEERRMVRRRRTEA